MPPKQSFTHQEDHIENYYVSVAKGEIPGSSGFTILANNPNMDSNFDDIWSVGGIRTEITGPESLELVSSDDNDTILGTGARTILVNSLDANFDTQFNVVAMDGQTPAPIPGTHLNPQRLIVLSRGSNPGNLGDITARVSGGGDPRSRIRAGFGISRDGFFWVPNGFNAFPVTVTPFWPKDQSGRFRVVTRLDGSAQADIIPIEFPVYQSGFDLRPLLPGVRPAKSRFTLRANSLNPTTEVDVFVELLVYPNTASAQSVQKLMEKLGLGM